MTDEPRLKADIGQKFYVWLEGAPADAFPCLTHLDNKLVEVKDKTWITYKGLASFMGDTYMRFESSGDDVLVPFSALKYLEKILHRFPGEKVKTPKPKFKKSKSAVKFLNQKTTKVKKRKPSKIKQKGTIT